MKNNSEEQHIVTGPACLNRRSFAKVIAAAGVGTVVSPFLSRTAQAAAGIARDANDLSAVSTTALKGGKIDWYGFDRYDFVMDSYTQAITPYDASNEGTSGDVSAPMKGQQRCILVTPKAAAAGYPWSWRGVYWNHMPQTEVELLKRGFHIGFISPNIMEGPGKDWDAWYHYLTENFKLSKKPAFIGMSRGGEFEYSWGSANPEKVSCIYADNPGANRGAFQRLGDLVAADVPVLQVCGSIDPLFGKYASAIDNIYHQFGGRISMMIKEGYAHHPHSLRNPKPIADFIEHSVKTVRVPEPAFAGNKFTRTSYYSIANSYRDYPDEGTHITCRGPMFVPCYDRYDFNIQGTPMTTNVIVPNVIAEGTPWVYRAGFVPTDATVDQSLLAKGFHIVTGPVGTDVDRPLVKDWNTVYEYFMGYGFSKRVVMEGAGGAARQSYAWAIENPDKVSCLYAENPELQSDQVKIKTIDILSPLAQAHVPLLHVSGSLDPAYKDSTLAVVRQYRKLGGHISVIVKSGVGHYPLCPQDPERVVRFIVRATYAP